MHVASSSPRAVCSGSWAGFGVLCINVCVLYINVSFKLPQPVSRVWTQTVVSSAKGLHLVWLSVSPGSLAKMPNAKLYVQIQFAR